MWTRDGVELREEVEGGEILPNHDGTFQISAELKLESVQPEDWTRYQCVFQLSGLKDDVVTTLRKDKILTNLGWTPRDPEGGNYNRLNVCLVQNSVFFFHLLHVSPLIFMVLPIIVFSSSDQQSNTTTIIIVAVCVLALVLLVSGFLAYRCMKGECFPSSCRSCLHSVSQ